MIFLTLQVHTLLNTDSIIHHMLLTTPTGTRTALLNSEGCVLAAELSLHWPAFVWVLYRSEMIL